MILNDEHRLAQEHNLRKLKISIAKFESIADCVDDQLNRLELQALQGFAIQFQQEIDDYDLLRSGKLHIPNSFSLSELPKILVQSRIALGWSQAELAEVTKTRLSKIELYEENLYVGASLSKKMEIAAALEIDIDRSMLLQGKKYVSPQNCKALFKVEDFDWEQFPIKEVQRRKWLANFSNPNRTKAFRDWFSKSTGSYVTAALHRKRSGGTIHADEPSLLTWQARILEIAEAEISRGDLPEFKIDDRWLTNLSKVSVESDGPAQVKNVLKEKGIVLVIEKHLPKTYLDGASLLSHDGIPIVGLTLRYNRLDYFWFTLFHELAHVYCHLYTRDHNNFIDRRILNETQKNSLQKETALEIEADSFASEKMIEPKLWESCISRHSASEKDVMTDANSLGLSPSIIAGRIRKERNNYSILNGLIGQNELHHHFEEIRM